MLEDFKAFIARGNVVDMAVGVIIGGAFGKIVSSLVSDVIMPPIGMLLSGINFRDLFINLSSTEYATMADAEAAGAPIIKYGLFINNVIDFLIVALVIFLMIRLLARMRPAKEEAATDKECPYCCSKIALGAVRCPHCTAELKETK